MVIKGVKHVAEINRMFDTATRQDRFRYTLTREGSRTILYWGHEHTEATAVEMANMYLTLLDDSVAELRDKPGVERVQLVATPRAA